MRRTTLLLAFALIGCGSDVATGRRCADGQRACASAGSSGAAGQSGGVSGGRGGAGGAIDSQDNALSVRVEREAMTIELITIACAGECAEVEAVARGGMPPYAFEWEDGSSSAQRTVCPTRSSAYEVTVEDTASSDPEFPYAGQSASAQVTAEVLECDDAGVGDAGVSDEVCFENPSFEGMPQRNETGSEIDLVPWTACTGPGRVLLTASTWDETIAEATQEQPSPLPVDGESYLRMTSCRPPDCFQPFLGEGTDLVSNTLCTPLRAGQAYSFSIALASPDALSSGWGNTRGALAVWGGNDPCQQLELLWTSPLLTPSFERHCVRFTPTRDTSELTFGIADAQGGLNFVYVDDIRAVDACP